MYGGYLYSFFLMERSTTPENWHFANKKLREDGRPNLHWKVPVLTQKLQTVITVAEYLELTC
jgi:hypothetical protein